MAGLTVVLAAVAMASRRRPRTDVFQVSAPGHDLYDIGSPPHTTMHSNPTPGRGYPSTFFDVQTPTGSARSGGNTPTATPPRALSPVRTHGGPAAEGVSAQQSSHGSAPVSEGGMVESEAGELQKVGAERGISGAGEGHRADD